MTATIDVSGMTILLESAATGLVEDRDRLTELDALVGDGDIGVTAELIGKTIASYTASPRETDIGKLLMNCGLEINKNSPSTFGTLLAWAFIEGGKAVLGRKTIDVEDLSLIGRGAIDGIKKRGRSNLGEKTMLDCLVPAVTAIERAVDEGNGYRIAIEAATKAAKEGAEATAGLMAVHGRAAYRQDRSVGVKDAGATAMLCMIEACGKALIGYLELQQNPGMMP